eukprot:Amastigsp_a178430_12.p3 type:complete len:273 gc:universal Amastigsp_a178430_12:915-97(-)
MSELERNTGCSPRENIIAVTNPISNAERMRYPPKIFPFVFCRCGCMIAVVSYAVSRMNAQSRGSDGCARECASSRHSCAMTACSSSFGGAIIDREPESATPFAGAGRRCTRLRYASSCHCCSSSEVGTRSGTTYAPPVAPPVRRATIVNVASMSGVSWPSCSCATSTRTSIDDRPVHVTQPWSKMSDIVIGARRSIRSTDAVTNAASFVNPACACADVAASASTSSRTRPSRTPPNELMYFSLSCSFEPSGSLCCTHESFGLRMGRAPAGPE